MHPITIAATALSGLIASMATCQSAANQIGSGSGSLYSLVVDGDKLLAVWQSLSGVYANASLDGGISWNGEQQIGSGSFPSACRAGDRTLVAWSSANAATVEYAVSTDNGLSFSAPQTLFTSSLDSRQPSLAANGSTVHVAWLEGTPGSTQILHRSSADAGQTWSSVNTVDSPLVFRLSPKLVAQSASDVAVGWVDGRGGTALQTVFCATSTNTGATWSAQQISANVTTSSDDSNVPLVGTNGEGSFSIAHGGGVLAVTWLQRLLGRRWVGGTATTSWGATWIAPRVVMGGPAPDTTGFESPSIAVSPSGTVLLAAGQTSDTTQRRIHMARSTNALQNTSIQLLDAPADSSILSQGVCVSHSGTLACATWIESYAQRGFQSRCSHDDGQTWSDLRTITQSGALQTATVVVCTPRGAHGVWETRFQPSAAFLTAHSQVVGFRNFESCFDPSGPLPQECGANQYPTSMTSPVIDGIGVPIQGQSITYEMTGAIPSPSTQSTRFVIFTFVVGPAGASVRSDPLDPATQSGLPGSGAQPTVVFHFNVFAATADSRLVPVSTTGVAQTTFSLPVDPVLLGATIVGQYADFDPVIIATAGLETLLR